MTSFAMNSNRDNFTVDCRFSTFSPLPAAVIVILYMLSAVVILFTLSGNLLVIICVCRFKQLQTPTNVLILSLASSDFLVGLFVMPVSFALVIETCWTFGAVACVFFYFTGLQLACQSTHNVTLLALDRYIALSNPFFYSEKVTLNVSIIVASLSWLFSIIYNPVLFHYNDLFVSSCEEKDSTLTLNEIWAFTDIMVVFVLPCSLMIILYCRIFSIARRHVKEIKKINIVIRPQAKKCQHNEKSNRKAAKSIGIVVSVFLLCLLPYYVSIFMIGIIDPGTVKILLPCTSLMFHLNSFFNPIIYALFYPCFRKRMKKLITFCAFSMSPSMSNMMK